MELSRFFFFFVVVVVLLSFMCSSKAYYEVDLSFSEGDLEIVSVEHLFSRTIIENKKSDEFDSYGVSVYNDQGELIHHENVSVLGFRYVDYFNDSEKKSGFVYSDEFNFTVYVPYSPQAKKIEISKDDSSFDLVELEPNRIGGIEQAEEVLKKERGESYGLFFFLIVLLFFLVFLSVFLYLVFLRQKKK